MNNLYDITHLLPKRENRRMKISETGHSFSYLFPTTLPRNKKHALLDSKTLPPYMAKMISLNRDQHTHECAIRLPFYGCVRRRQHQRVGFQRRNESVPLVCLIQQILHLDVMQRNGCGLWSIQ